MRLIALLSWFDEDPMMLQELIDSLTVAGVDHLVALDGAYRDWPGHQTISSPAEFDMIREACWRNMDLTLHSPSWRYAGNEIEKRNLLFKLGHAVAEPYNDWLWVIDADEVVTRSNRYFRVALESTIHDVGTVTEYGDGNERRERRLFRAHPKGIHLLGKHSHYVNGNLDVLWGMNEVQAVHLDVEVKHRPHLRSEARTMARNGYYRHVVDNKTEILS